MDVHRVRQSGHRETLLRVVQQTTRTHGRHSIRVHAWTDRGEQLRQRILILGDQSESSTIRRRCVRPGALSDSFGVPAAAAAAAQQPGSAGATRPKLEVLQALPEAQLFPLMNLVATSLGVRCDYCHVQANPDLPRTPSNLGGWVWDRDDS